MSTHSIAQKSDVTALTEFARSVRLDVLDMTARMGGIPRAVSRQSRYSLCSTPGEYCGSGPRKLDWPDRDRFILSKEHAAPALYAVLARPGYFPPSELARFRCMDSPYHSHPKQDISIGVEVTSGSLGQRLSFGLGTAFAGRLGK